MSANEWEALQSRRAGHFVASEIREFTKLMSNPDVILLAGGVPDPRLFPISQLRSGYVRVLSDTALAGAALQYAPSEGHEPLRQWIAGYMTQRGVLCNAENVLIVNGSQQGLDLVGKLFLDPGDVVGVFSPTYLGALQAFSTYEARYVILPREDDVAGIEQLRSAKPKLIYAMADFQNPTGISLTLNERKSLAALAVQTGALLIEDNAYAELRYEGQSLPTLTALAIAGRSINACRNVYLGTFSKSVVPGLRLGWIVGPRDIIGKLVIAKQASDLQASTINQIVLTDFLHRHYEDWSQHIRTAYRERRDVMVAALERIAPNDYTWSRPEGGYFVWVEGPAHLDAHSLLTRAVSEVGVAFVPGRPFHADGTGQNTFRLSFSNAPIDQLSTGIERLFALSAQIHRRSSIGNIHGGSQ